MTQQTDTILDEILIARRKRILRSKEKISYARLEKAAHERRLRRDFAAALSQPGLQVIAELKKASPSRGLLREDYRVSEIASSYQAAGAAAISVLTEPDFFLGSLEDLQAAKNAAGVPCLRKDFIVDAYQIVESAAAGADAVLLIVAALTDEELQKFAQLAESSAVSALVEVHTDDELDRALAAGAKLIGVNNRDLRTLEIELQTSFRLRRRIPSGCVSVSESGIQTAVDLRRLEDAGFDAALIGEHFMLAPDPGRELAGFIQGLKSS